MKLAEEYYWAITQAAGRSYWCVSGWSVLQFGLQLGSQQTLIPQLVKKFPAIIETEGSLAHSQASY
jgi:hypothetical protein